MKGGAALRHVAVVVPEHFAEAFPALDFADVLIAWGNLWIGIGGFDGRPLPF